MDIGEAIIVQDRFGNFIGGYVAGRATGGTETTLTDTIKNFDTDILKNKILVMVIDGIQYFRKISSHTSDTLTFAAPVASVAGIAVVEKSGGGKVTITTTEKSADVNAYTIVVEEGVGASVDTKAVFADGVLTITLGTDAGTAASADIGSGADGTITTTFKEVGVKTGYTIKVTTQATLNAAMSVGWNAGTKKILVTLGTDGAGAPDATKNTATLITAAINGNVQLSPLFTAVASGDGSGVFAIAIADVSFAGGVDPVVDGTAAEVAAAVDFLTEFAAVETTGGDLEALASPVAFTGGVTAIMPVVGTDYEVQI